MDLDLWIAKAKEGQHLAEHELQSLCEYVLSSRLSDAILLPL
jgi:serine/threonine-protein phosphatase 6 catalytic subunit